MTKNSDFVVTSYAQNAHIVRALKNLELWRINRIKEPSVENLCALLRLDHKDNKQGLARLEREVRELVGLQRVPQKPNGEWIEAALEISRLVKTPPEELWPGALATVIPHERSQKTEISIGEATAWTVMEMKTEEV